MAAYHHAGITADQRTWARPAPLLADLAAALRADGTPPAVTLADRLVPYTGGTHAALVLRADHAPAPPGTWSCSACGTCPRN